MAKCICIVMGIRPEYQFNCVMLINSDCGDCILNGSDTVVRFYMCKKIMNPPPLNWNHAKTEE